MASAEENVPVAPHPLLPRQTSISPRPPSALRPKMAHGATEPLPVSGVLKCTCFRLPSRSKKALPPPPPAAKLHTSAIRSVVAPDVSAATASQSQRITFRASASLSTLWPSSPSAASAGAGAAGATATPAPAGSGGSLLLLAPRRSSARSASSSSRVMPHGERASFSFAVSPASPSSSCMSTPKISLG